MRFKIGDEVTWDSQAGGSWTTKNGTVVDIAGFVKDSNGNLTCRRALGDVMMPGSRYHEFSPFADRMRMFDGMVRVGDVIVEVRPSVRSKPRLYKPLLSSLSHKLSREDDNGQQ